MDTPSLSNRLRGLLNQELAQDERILWIGQPVPASAFPQLQLASWFIGLPVTLFALCWMVGAAGVIDPVDGWQGVGQLHPVRVVFGLLGLPFVLCGLGFLTAPWWMPARIRRAAQQTAYVVTNARALILEGGYFGESDPPALLAALLWSRRNEITIRSWTARGLGRIEQVVRDDGSGDVRFGAGRATFFSIPDAKNAAALLQRMTATGVTNDSASSEPATDSPAAPADDSPLVFPALFCAGAAVLALILAWITIPEWRVNQHYVENQCVVLDKRLGRASGTTHPAFRPEILIRHRVNGENFEAWTYDASEAYSGRRSRAEAILEEYEVGRPYPCWYDPDDPERVVLVRGYSLLPNLLLMAPLLLMAVGAGGTFVSWRKRSHGAEARLASCVSSH